MKQVHKSHNYNRRSFFAACAGGFMSMSCADMKQGRFYMPPADASALSLYDHADPPTLDPARSWGWLDGRLAGLVFSNLVRFDRQAN
ncbi:MAG: hypothetical protein JXR73_03255, partial [Candidatus Omnitrophica bacterium]|nr:hypothetical protein [Candidatus Omnitrophota bacterium]